ncbi:MAG TPA: hypothetical protein VFT82_04455 [Candidatus Paceibacterota bacterium]|nr:hypothetical protein [Candidatus Paceibacterota bacterium]
MQIQSSSQLVLYLFYLFFAVEIVVCATRASRSRPILMKTIWMLFALAGVTGFVATAYAHSLPH